jgi:hypothetical protein
MTIDELKLEVASYRRALTEKGKSGHLVKYTSAGPVGMPLIDKLLEVMESQQQQIDDLKANINCTVESAFTPRPTAIGDAAR